MKVAPQEGDLVVYPNRKYFVNVLDEAVHLSNSVAKLNGVFGAKFSNTSRRDRVDNFPHLLKESVVVLENRNNPIYNSELKRLRMACSQFTHLDYKLIALVHGNIMRLEYQDGYARRMRIALDAYLRGYPLGSIEKVLDSAETALAMMKEYRIKGSEKFEAALSDVIAHSLIGEEIDNE